MARYQSLVKQLDLENASDDGETQETSRGPRTSDRGRAVSADDAALLEAVIDDRQPDSNDPAVLARWRELRGRLRRDECGSPFDPRAVLRLSSAQYAEWCERRSEWRAKRLGRGKLWTIGAGDFEAGGV
jgi:hypothetical protein